MFGWFKKKPIAPVAQIVPVALQVPRRDRPRKPVETRKSPGVASSGNIDFTNAIRTWQESFDCVQLLREALVNNGAKPDIDSTTVVDSETGLRCRPLLVEFQPGPPEVGGIRTVTTIEVSHPLLGEEILFEFQHATGEDLVRSLLSGFDQWCKTDFVALSEATRDKPSQCLTMIAESPIEGRSEKRRRRIIFGPVAHYRQFTPPNEKPSEDEHLFCPCCLFTRSAQAFKSLLEQSGSAGLRLFAMRTADGNCDADCRMNGIDYLEGKAALKSYAQTWDAAGVEFRKQYVVIQDLPS